jgi:hypothetical protein
MNRPFIACALALVLASIAGCGAGGDHPTVYPVTGTVIYKGQPVADAVVAFQGENATKLATGKTDAQGRFQLTTYEPGDGAVPGKHHASVSKVTATPAASTTSASMEDAAAAAKTQTQAVAKSELPEQYADPARSQLEFTVTESGPNDFQIDLGN